MERKHILSNIVKGLLLMYLVTIGLLLVLTLLLSKLQLTENAVSVGVIIIYVIAGFVGGFWAGKKMKIRKYLWGVIIGMSYFAILIICSVIFHRGLDMEMGRLATTFVLCMASGMIGGMLS